MVSAGDEPIAATSSRRPQGHNGQGRVLSNYPVASDDIDDNDDVVSMNDSLNIINYSA
jgi:hypothetical protein